MQPPTNGGRSEVPPKDVAIYIDYENLYISLRSTVNKNPSFEVIMEKCREFGRVTVARAYADWSEFARVLTSQMFSSGLEPIYVPTRKFYDAKTRSQATKNSVDIHITIDIIKDVLLSKNIDVFVLVSGDRDFVPLMNQIRAAGKEVYAIGVAGCTSSELAVAVDEMFYYHQLFETEEDVAAEQADIYAKLVRAVEIARARGYRATPGVVKPIMREVVGGFHERNFRDSKGRPFQKFTQFVEEAVRQGFIKTVDSSGSLELMLANDSAAKKTGRAPRSGEEDREGGRTRGGRGRRSGPASAGSETGEEETESRRRTRRGGRRRRSSRANGTDDERPEERAEETAEQDEVVEVEATEAGIEEADTAPPPEAKKPSRRAPARKQKEKEEKAKEQVEEKVEEKVEEEEADEAEALPEDVSLPAEAFDDLKAMLDTFGGRAPSQRRLVARLKKGAAGGELKGTYQEGQFLLMVRKALEDDLVERVSKGFYSGLRWKEQEKETDAATVS